MTWKNFCHKAEVFLSTTIFSYKSGIIGQYLLFYMNKQLGILLVVIVVAVGFYMLGSEDGTRPATNTGATTQQPVLEAPGVTVVVQENLKSSGTYQVVSAESGMNWQGQKTVLTEWIDTGTIGIKDGAVELQNGLITKANLTIDMATIAPNKTGMNGKFDMLAKHLKSADFFDAEKFPTSTFVMTKATKTDNLHEYLIDGNLTIKGKTLPASITALVFEESGVVKATGSVTLDRSKWDVRYGSGKFFQNLGDKAINDNFLVGFSLVAKK